MPKPLTVVVASLLSVSILGYSTIKEVPPHCASSKGENWFCGNEIENMECTCRAGYEYSRGLDCGRRQLWKAEGKVGKMHKMLGAIGSANPRRCVQSVENTTRLCFRFAGFDRTEEDLCGVRWGRT